MRSSWLSTLLAIIVFGLTVPAYLLAVQVAVTYVKLQSGFRAAGGLWAILPLTFAEVAALLVPGPYLRRAREPREMWMRLCRALALVFALYPLIEAVQLLIFIPVVQGRVDLYLQQRSVGRLAVAGAGLALAVGAVGAARALRRPSQTGDASC